MEAISIITTVLNERAAIEPLIASLAAQQPPAAEILVVDGGSTDGTWEWLLAAQSRYPTLMPIRDESCNRSGSEGPIARGRNVAIAAAGSPIIACVDAGCRYRSDWLARLTAPILAHEAGYALGGASLDPEQHTVWDVASSIFLGVKLRMDEPTKSCTARSMAFRREIWQQVGGFPEQAFFGEDTLFDAQLRALTSPAFPLGAKALYHPRNSFLSAARQLASYARADGVLGVRLSRQLRHLLRALLMLAAVLLLPWTWIPLAADALLELYFAFYHDGRQVFQAGPRAVLARIVFGIAVPWVITWNQLIGRMTHSYAANRQNMR